MFSEPFAVGSHCQSVIDALAYFDYLNAVHASSRLRAKAERRYKELLWAQLQMDLNFDPSDKIADRDRYEEVPF